MLFIGRSVVDGSKCGILDTDDFSMENKDVNTLNRFFSMNQVPYVAHTNMFIEHKINKRLGVDLVYFLSGDKKTLIMYLVNARTKGVSQPIQVQTSQATGFYTPKFSPKNPEILLYAGVYGGMPLLDGRVVCSTDYTQMMYKKESEKSEENKRTIAKVDEKKERIMQRRKQREDEKFEELRRREIEKANALAEQNRREREAIEKERSYPRSPYTYIVLSKVNEDGKERYEILELFHRVVKSRTVARIGVEKHLENGDLFYNYDGGNPKLTAKTRMMKSETRYASLIMQDNSTGINYFVVVSCQTAEEILRFPTNIAVTDDLKWTLKNSPKRAYINFYKDTQEGKVKLERILVQKESGGALKGVFTEAEVIARANQLRQSTNRYSGSKYSSREIEEALMSLAVGQ